MDLRSQLVAAGVKSPPSFSLEGLTPEPLGRAPKKGAWVWFFCKVWGQPGPSPEPDISSTGWGWGGGTGYVLPGMTVFPSCPCLGFTPPLQCSISTMASFCHIVLHPRTRLPSDSQSPEGKRQKHQVDPSLASPWLKHQVTPEGSPREICPSAQFRKAQGDPSHSNPVRAHCPQHPGVEGAEGTREDT
jgi:hypothetical protein